MALSRLNVWLEPHPKLDGLAPIDHLFNRFDGLYPHKFRSAFGCEQAVENWRLAWAEGFAQEGLTVQDVKTGLDVCRKRFAWPPSFAEFLVACRPVLEPEAAFFEAVTQLQLRDRGKDTWSHPAIFWAATKIGAFDMRNGTWGSMKTRWTAALDAEMKKGSWREIPPAALSLPAPGKQSVSVADSKKRISEAMAMLKSRFTNRVAA